MANASNLPDFRHYLNGRSKAERLASLQDLGAAKASLPISLAEDLLCLDLSLEEKLAILNHTSSRDHLALEHFLTQIIATGPQELATLALRQWNQTTQHLLWFRIQNLLTSPLTSQRVFYTIVDLAFWTGGARVLQAASETDGLESMAEALQGLILHRACEWNVSHPKFDALAHACFAGLSTHLHPENKALPSALSYLARFYPQELRALRSASAVAEPWRDLIRAIAGSYEHAAVQSEQITKLIKKTKPTSLAALEPYWPPLWQRHSLSVEVVGAALAAASTQSEAAAPVSLDSAVSSPWEFFAGIETNVLEQATVQLPGDADFAAALTRLGGLLAVPATPSMLTALKDRLTTTAEPAALLTLLPLRLRIELTEAAPSTGRKGLLPYAQVKREEAAVLNGQKVAPVSFPDTQPAAAEDPEAMASRKRFFNMAYRGDTLAPGKTSGFFDLLTQAWCAPSGDKLAPLAETARQVDGLFRLCYLNTLGHFKGVDGAVLKLMDFIRTQEMDDLHAVIAALGAIATPRAALELVACLTRPNVPPPLQLETCLMLKKQNLENLQKELHSAINDLGIVPDTQSVRWEIRELVVSMLDSTAAAAVAAPPTGPVAGRVDVSDQRLDQELGGKIPSYRELSSEVKRALRTAQFFHMQVSTDTAPASIDLSPVIDMQYKSLELLFREVYEEVTSRLIHRGVLQRRLDIIGYARPIPAAMDEFEHYISSLPTVREIPFFSSFKLRKMLRAICQFRPGRRFTLDGLKAFALFFLCFSRSECRFGLAGLFPLGFRSDSELLQFVKSLHMMQDFRNRAAHEGFHPDAASDIDGIWLRTAEIVQTVFATRQSLGLAPADDRDSRQLGHKKVS